MKLFGKQKNVQNVSEAYRTEKNLSKKRKYWDTHTNDPNYDPMYDFRVITKDKKKKLSFLRRKKAKKKDEFEEGVNRVRNIINR